MLKRKRFKVIKKKARLVKGINNGSIPKIKNFRTLR